MKKKFFEDDLLYVVDGELMNQLIKLLSALDIIDAGPEKQRYLAISSKPLNKFPIILQVRPRMN